MAKAKYERELAARGEGCLGKAADNEPVFILRGQDKFAPLLVRMWVQLALLHGCDGEKIEEAAYLADDMERWKPSKFPD
jgi:hypothetical protein